MPVFSRTNVGFVVIMLLLLFLNYSDFELVEPYYHSWNDVLILVLGGQNMITTHLIYQKSKDDQSLFPILVIISFTFRLIIAVLIMTLVWFFEVGEVGTFAINLIVIYLVFLAFELYSLLTNLRAN